MVQPGAIAGSISPDGRTLATLGFTDDNSRIDVWIASPPEAPRRPYAPAPFRTLQFYNVPKIAFSPDGRKILLAINLDTRGETLWLLPWPEGPATQLWKDGVSFAFTPQFSWFPDSRHAAFSDAGPVRYSHLYMLDTRGGRYWPVLVEDRPAGAPTVSPDGLRIAYQSALSHSDVVAVPLDDGPVRTVLGSSRNESMAHASSVAPQLVYVTDRRGLPEVWITSMLENWDRPLLSPGTVGNEQLRGFMSPEFSPDGRRIVVSVNTQSGSRLYTMFAAGGSPVRATPVNDQAEFAPAWSPDGVWLVYERVVGSVRTLSKIRPGSGEPPVSLIQTTGASVPEWSPTGEWIACHESEGHVTLVSPDGKTTRQLPGDYGPLAWSRDGKTLYQIRAVTPALLAIDVATGKDRVLRDLPGLVPYSNLNPGLRASLTSDGKSIVYTVNRARQEIWILDGGRAP
jgi:Tol biopolymer transport system component